MGDVARWLQQNLWAGLAAGAAAGFAIAAVLTCLAFLLRKPSNIDDGALSLALQERQRVLLLCGDAKALADLAIQRHMGDTLFLQQLRTQSCNVALSSHFSEEFRHQIAQERDDRQGRPTLATAYRKEIERLEQEWR
jgi:hypothetical protein